MDELERLASAGGLARAAASDRLLVLTPTGEIVERDAAGAEIRRAPVGAAPEIAGARAVALDARRRVAIATDAEVHVGAADEGEAVTFAASGVVALASGPGSFFAATEGSVLSLTEGTRKAVTLGAIDLCPTHLAVSRSGRYLAVASDARAAVYFTEEWRRVLDVALGEGRTEGLALDGEQLVIARSTGLRRERFADPPEAAEAPRAQAETPLVLRGNPLRWLSGGAVALVGLLLGMLAVMLPWSSRHGVIGGAAATLLTTAGVLALLGFFSDRGERIPVASVARPAAWALAGALATFVALRLAVRGAIGPWDAAIYVPATFLFAVWSAGRLGAALGYLSDGRPVHRREGFWLIVISTLVLLPALGSRSLTDPWETHYGEVAREILARQDWITLWWAHEKFFMSKPVLGFWMQSLSMAALGVGYEPGRMLAEVVPGSPPWPEWAVRFPTFLVTLGATYVLYKAIARTFGARAGLFGGVVLTTMPQWFFIANQTMTDMPFVATMTAALGFFLLAAHEDPDREVRTVELKVGSRTVGLSARHLVVGAVVALVVPQIVYLVTRNLEIALDPAFGLRMPPIQPAVDSFVFGSADNCGASPGNPKCEQLLPEYRRFYPALQALLWAQVLAVFAWLVWGERRAQRLLFIAAFLCAALSTMAKGPAGLVLPVAAVLGYLVVTRRFGLLLRMELAAGAMSTLAVAAPWFVAMYVRHGSAFTDRLFFYDMVKRAFGHAHDTNEGDDVSFRYYVWQLGYATFPWIGLGPLALFGQRDRARTEERDETDARGTFALLFAWVIATFALFSYMQTKFHHYILPALPALAALTGIAVDRVWGAVPTEGVRELRRRAVALSIGPALAFGALLTAKPTWGGALALLALGCAAVVGLGLTSERAQPVGDRYRAATTSLALVGGAALVALAGRDLAADRAEQPSGARLMHLFSYDYGRAWPEHLDFSGPLWAFTFAASVLLAAAASERLRRAALSAFAATAVCFAGWALDAYFAKTAPHFGQRETILRYYGANEEEAGPLVAYQMNWKGENFYTGNQVAILLDRGKEARAWFSTHRKKGQKTFYVVLIPGMEDALQSDLGKAVDLQPLTTAEQNNKFTLLRARYP